MKSLRNLLKKKHHKKILLHMSFIYANIAAVSFRYCAIKKQRLYTVSNLEMLKSLSKFFSNSETKLLNLQHNY